jgi:hypothetical protein
MFKLSKLKLKGITINQRYTHTNTHGDVYLFYMYTLFINLHFESRLTFVRNHFGGYYMMVYMLHTNK